MELRLSQHEVITKCTQALRSLNVPPGLDIENGKNIGWLATRGLPGLQILFEEIKTASNNSNHPPIKIKMMKDTVQFSSKESSAFYLTQAAVDFAENGKCVRIKNCRFPLLILAEMARREHLPFGFQMQWIKDDEINRGVSISGNSEITVNSLNLTTAYNLKLTANKNLIIKKPLQKFGKKNASDDLGISFNPDHWEAICSKAKNVLVPDSEQSHSNAGAEVDDSI